MTKSVKTPKSRKTGSHKTIKTGRRTGGSSRVLTTYKGSGERIVTPTSERIIKETSAKRRKAMKVLANR